jgi:PAS domain S-box-containing protein
MRFISKQFVMHERQKRKMGNRQDKGARPLYKISISALLGLIGFLVNFKSVYYEFPPYQTALLPGLIFPMMVALAWGWLYGSLSAVLALGCQIMWFTWVPPACGWGPCVTIPMLALWITWHGWFARGPFKTRLPAPKVWTAEIMFRACQSFVFYLLWYGSLKWPALAWVRDDGTLGQSVGFVYFSMAASVLNGYIVLVTAHVFLNIGSIRKLLTLGRLPSQLTTGLVISASMLFGLIFWMIDGLVDYYKFREHLRFLLFKAPESIWDSIFLKVPSPDLFARTAFVITCVTGGLLVARLLQKQSQVDAALRRSETRYRRLHETMLDAFVQMDMSGRIVDLNHAFGRMIGHNPEMMLGCNENDLSPDKWRGQVEPIIARQVIGRGHSDVYEKEYNRADGTVFPAELRTFLITDDNGRPIGMWSIVRDITTRKKTELEREKVLTALRRSNEDLKQFAYVASHDLQEPLRMVASYTQLLADRYRGRLDDRADKYINYAVDGTQRMQALIQGLLAYSRVETEIEEFEPVNARSALALAIANLRAMIDETGSVVTTDPLPDVRADKTQLAQIFQNLINNSIKFRSHQPACIHVSAESKNGGWQFCVKDNGIGINPKYKNKIFVVFQRLHTRQEYPGTGIGLALCKRIVDRHRGRIWFESTPGQGTSFYFTIPN